MKAWLGWKTAAVEGGAVFRDRCSTDDRRVLVTEWPEGAPEGLPRIGDRVRWTGIGRGYVGTVRTLPREMATGEWWVGVEWYKHGDEVWYKPVSSLQVVTDEKHYRATYPASSEAEARERYGIPEGVTGGGAVSIVTVIAIAIICTMVGFVFACILAAASRADERAERMP